MKSIAVNGIGTIGKRVADAVSAQDDMKIVGVCKTKPDFEAKVAVEKGYPLYIAIPEREQLFKDAGIEIAGTVDDMISEADLVVDCTPGKFGKEKNAFVAVGVDRKKFIEFIKERLSAYKEGK